MVGRSPFCAGTWHDFEPVWKWPRAKIAELLQIPKLDVAPDHHTNSAWGQRSAKNACANCPLLGASAQSPLRARGSLTGRDAIIAALRFPARTEERRQSASDSEFVTGMRHSRQRRRSARKWAKNRQLPWDWRRMRGSRGARAPKTHSSVQNAEYMFRKRKPVPLGLR